MQKVKKKKEEVAFNVTNQRKCCKCGEPRHFAVDCHKKSQNVVHHRGGGRSRYGRYGRRYGRRGYERGSYHCTIEEEEDGKTTEVAFVADAEEVLYTDRGKEEVQEKKSTDGKEYNIQIFIFLVFFRTKTIYNCTKLKL